MKKPCDIGNVSGYYNLGVLYDHDTDVQHAFVIVAYLIITFLTL